MEKRYEMRFSGSGGQGVILASIILAEAAVLSDLNAVQSQSYGPEARGGLCKAETILSRETIWFSKVIKPNFLLVLTQESLNKYVWETAEDAVILAERNLTIPEGLGDRRVFSLPILDTAKTEVGRVTTANIVAVGAINRLTGLFSEDVVTEAVLHHVPAGTEDLNKKALTAGQDLVTKDMIQSASDLLG